jgi:CRP/FNR family transcriptional regulator, cyclic AMP receptor protein
MVANKPALSSEKDTIFAEPAFRQMSGADRDAVLARAVKKVFRPGAFVYRRGDKPDGIYIVLKGLVRVTGVSRQGDEFILELCGPGFWIGEIAVLEGSERSHDAVAETRSEVLYLACSDFEHLLYQLSGFARALLRLEAKRFRQAADWAERSATAPLAARLALRLAMFARRSPMFGMTGRDVEMRLTQQTLSNLVGTTRQRINQLLHEWEADGLIRLSRGGLTILRLDELEADFANP